MDNSRSARRSRPTHVPKYPPIRRARGQTGPHVVEQGAEGYADRHFVDAGPVHPSRHCHQHRSGLVGRANQPEPVRAEASDKPNVGQGLHVVDQGGPLTNAGLVGAVPELRASLPSIYPRHEGGLLASHVPARGLDHLHHHVIGALGRGDAQGGGGVRVGPVDGDEGPIRA